MGRISLSHLKSKGLYRPRPTGGSYFILTEIWQTLEDTLQCSLSLNTRTSVHFHLRQVLLPAGREVPVITAWSVTQASLYPASLFIHVCDQWKIEKLELQNTGFLQLPFNVFPLTAMYNKEHFINTEVTSSCSAMTFLHCSFLVSENRQIPAL